MAKTDIEAKARELPGVRARARVDQHPAPEEELRALHRRRVRRRARAVVLDDLARRPRRRSRRSRRRTRPTSTRPSPRRAAPTTRPGRRCQGRDRGKYLFRIARLVQERARELAVAESLDNGKPIKESRDVDVPLVAAWFFYYAGWADKLDYAGLGANPRALGVAAQVIPWNFPLLMLAWKIAPALAAGNTVVLKPAETTPLSALLFAEILQQADLPARRREHRHRRGRDRRGAGRGIRMSTRSRSPARPASAARSPRRSPAPARRSPSSSAARRRTSSSTTPRSTRPSRASSTASSSTRATSAAPDQPAARAGEHPRRMSSTASSSGSRPCASATRSTRTPTSARSTRASSSTASGR